MKFENKSKSEFMKYLTPLWAASIWWCSWLLWARAKGTIHILRKQNDYKGKGGLLPWLLENMHLCRGGGATKKLKKCLRNVWMVPCWMDVDTASKDSRLLAYRMLWMVSELEAENKKERVTKTILGWIMKIWRTRNQDMEAEWSLKVITDPICW